ncbi:VOC family protein [Nocardia wallacei]|uniref:VOC family protein n=1 Tax=Nocardia wallacei TaxID=480035 RepID=UPI002453F12A|nr:VOC family protein [Nocardia wallacei]
MVVKPIPDGYPRVSPFVVATPAAEAIAYYKDVFGAVERLVVRTPDGQINHSELQIGDSVVFVVDENADWKMRDPKHVGGTPVPIHVWVEDPDAVFTRAIDAGASQVYPPSDMYQGDRGAAFTDPFGHTWWVAARQHEFSAQEMDHAIAEAIGKP